MVKSSRRSAGLPLPLLEAQEPISTFNILKRKRAADIILTMLASTETSTETYSVEISSKHASMKGLEMSHDDESLRGPQ